LELLFEFFNQNICPDYKPEKLIDCYNSFFKKIEQSDETGEIELNILFENQKKIYDNFSDSTFQEIWSFEKSWNDEDVPHNNFKTVHLNLSGKYLEFLKKVAEDDKVIKSYFGTIEAAGDITPSLVKGLLANHSYYDIKDIRVIFIVAIHYLTLNDQFGRKERVLNKTE
jgi:hypothetical protein